MASMDLYSYCNGDPVNQYDADGRITIVIPGVGSQQDRGILKTDSNEDFIRAVQAANPGAQVFGRDNAGMARAINAIQAAKQNGDDTVNIFGYSRGGVGAVNLANKLNTLEIPVNNLILTDPVIVKIWGDTSLNPLQIPLNVQNTVNYYQNSGNPLQWLSIGNFIGTPATGPNVKNYPNPTSPQYGTFHQNMPAIVDGNGGYKLTPSSAMTQSGNGNTSSEEKFSGRKPSGDPLSSQVLNWK